MKHLYEQDMVGDQQYAKDLLNVQAWYNKEMLRLNDMLAKKKSDAMVAYQTRAAAASAQQKAAAANQPQKTAPTTQQAAATGTVTTTGQPVTASGNPPAQTVESYPDILRINTINEDDEIRISHGMDPYGGRDTRNWYQKPENRVGYVEPEKAPRRKKMTSKVQNQIWDIEGQIEDLKNEIKWAKEEFESPSYEGAEGEVEQFFAEIGPEASEILNSGAYNTDEEKAFALREVGIEKPEQIIQDYYYYYPEYDPRKEKERNEAEEKVQRLETEIEQLENKLSQLEEMYESVNEAKFNIENVDRYEIQDLKDYMDAESISYSEDEDGSTIDFDETELDREWNDRLDDMGMERIGDFEEAPSTDVDDILSIDDEDSDDEDFTEEDERIDEDKVFYVKVEDEGEAFIGKIYKLFDEGDWRSKIVDGESETFEQLNYDPDWDEVDIVAFLRENYADAEIVSEDEFNDHVEEPAVEPEETEEEPEVQEGLHAIPTLNNYLTEYGKKPLAPEIKYWDDNVLTNRQQIAVETGLPSDIAYKKWEELTDEEQYELRVYWSIKKLKRQRKGWSADDMETRVRSFSGGWEKDSWRGPNPNNH
jgi:hypothetical protein